MDPIFLNKTCDPFDPRETPCQIGAYVQYAVNVSSPEHVVKTVQFVKEHNIRFVVKNTGHDFMGRSTGTGAVSVWMHNVKNLTFIDQYNSKSSDFTGTAIKVGAGVIGGDLAAASHERGLAAVGGECPTVGFAGGYLQGGGHSLLSSAYGLAADQALEYEVITTQGDFVHASPTENEDLYWALSGGGGGTYGIVWSVTVKAHKDLPITVGSINFTSESAGSLDKFWQGIDAYQDNNPALLGAKVYYITQYSQTNGSGSFSLNPIFAVNQSVAEVTALVRPLLDNLEKLDIKYEFGANTIDGYLPAYDSVGYLRNFPVAATLVDTRIIPRSLWNNNDTLTNFKKTIRGIVESGVLVFDWIQQPSLEVAEVSETQNAVLPAWRDMAKLFGSIIPLFDGESVEQQRTDRNRMGTDVVAPLKEFTSGGSGATYGNEAHPDDPNWKVAIYGSTYDRLLSIKDKWDPDQVLYGAVSVGGDRWRETGEGRLCRVDQ
ncbi:hypothetical protein V5O48_016213 [Marasmius crinis-equi]|uniref:FAD-binding PCMH-type domain-containing protein n=1 Tax=Marasmius crinis-equi TaxID=585013 RepID=A0ABR3ESB0_9AGAR